MSEASNSVFDKKLENLNEAYDSAKLWKGTFRQFLQKYKEDRAVSKNIGVLAHQRIYNMIISGGTKKEDHFGKERTKYAFFEDSLYGIEESIDAIMSYIHSAAQKTETSRRMLMLFGPPSAGKSSLVTRLKRGLEEYTRTPEGAMYAISGSKMHENPFLLVPESLRPDFEQEYGLRIEGQLNPVSAMRLRDEFHGKFMDYPVEQIYIDESLRVGIGTFLPSDPKCLTSDCDILTSKGWRKGSEIFSHFLNFDEKKEDIYVNDGRNNFVKIKNCFDNGLQNVYTISLAGHSLLKEVKATKGHRFLALKSDGTFEMVPVDKLSGRSLPMYFSGSINLEKEIIEGIEELISQISQNFDIELEERSTYNGLYDKLFLQNLLNYIKSLNSEDKTGLIGRLENLLSYSYGNVFMVQRTGVEQVFDIEVDSPDHMFVVTNGLISHNSQDQSELVGSIDFAKIQEFGDEADPRSYNFNGELNVANRGIMEFVEGLRADERFLRVLLTVTQEKSLKAPRFGFIYCDTFIILHSNENEFRSFMAEKKFEAYHDRMVIVKVPYNMSTSNEVKIYTKLIETSDAIKGIHVAPKTLEAAAMFAILSRLSPPPDGGDLTLIKKMKLYDKQHVRGHKIEQVPTLRNKDSHEGMSGVSPRFIIDQISAAISTAKDEGRDYVTALDVLRQLNKAVKLRDSFPQDKKNHFEALIDEARKEWDDMLRNDIQKAFFVCYEDEARALCENYLDQIEAACSGEKPKDPVTGEESDLDEKLMDSIEEQIDITSSGKEDFRNEILRAVGTFSRKNKKFDYTEHAQLKEAIQKKLFEERKSVIRMTVSARNPDPEGLKKINEVIARMVDHQGYSTGSANALLKYASSQLFDK